MKEKDIKSSEECLPHVKIKKRTFNRKSRINQ